VLGLKSRFFRQQTISEAASAMGLSRRQFTELFRKVTGQSWCQYVLGLRLNHAAGLLADTDRSVVAVAFESGFDDLSGFNHSFKACRWQKLHPV
jgi:AraC family L-rhamnose operon regulatory protein RhaS